ncbi:MAG: YczE/YyaS/YitT family protein [Nitriliruptoraceae bacterium]
MSEATPGPSHPHGTPAGGRAARRANHRPEELRRRVPRLLGGLVLCGVGIAVMVAADLGLGPWDVLHQGLSRRSGIPIGTTAILVGLLVLALWFPLRERPGLGTVLNVLIIGLVIDLVLLLLATPDDLWLRWVLMLAGPVLFAVGSGYYIGAGLGPGPRDGVMTGLARRGVPVGLARLLLELTVLAAGWLLGGTVGPGTLAFALGIGPLVHVVLPRLTLPDAA